MHLVGRQTPASGCCASAKRLSDAGGGKGVKDEKGRKKKKVGDEEEEEEETYYDAMKKDMGDRAARTKVGKDPLIFHVYTLVIICRHPSSGNCSPIPLSLVIPLNSFWPSPGSTQYV